MKSLQALTSDDVMAAFNGDRTLEFTVLERATLFRKVFPQLDFSKPTEIPPTPIALNSDTIAWAILHGGDTMHGQYASLVLLIYWSGGTITYTRTSPDEYVASVRWPPRPQM